MKSGIQGIKGWEVTSPPSRGAWIEIHKSDWILRVSCVAPLAGGVD